jgi:acetolactate synthase I/II/III large subunit
MKLADYTIGFFADKGVKDIFEVYGSANADLIDAFVRTEGTRYVSTMHEQAAGFAAEACAKVTGRPGVAIATSGPGGQNFVTPIANCFYDSVPAVFLTGQVKSQFMRPDPGIRQRGFQECPLVEIMEPITKYSKLVENPQDIKFELEKAWFLAQDGRPGPVFLDFPIDVQQADIDPKTLVGFDGRPLAASYDPKAVEAAVMSYLADLKDAQRPAILVGAGVRHAKALGELEELADKLEIPMFPTWNALDIVTSDSEWYGGRFGTYGGKGRNIGIQNADLVLAIGSRISGRLFGGNKQSFLRGAKTYCVDIDPTILQKNFQEVPFDINVHSDAKVFLGTLLDKLQGANVPDFSDWTAKVKGWKDKYDPVLPEYLDEDSNEGHVNPYAFVRSLSHQMKEKDILLTDCGGNIVLASQAFETQEGQRFLTNNGNSPMGFSFAASMGAALEAGPDQNVVCMIGDGGFNMNIQELQTVKNYDLDFKTFILNNHCYGITRQFQRTKFEGRQEACGPKGYSPPNFMEICKAYGIPTSRIPTNNPEIMAAQIKEILAHKGPVVCDVDCGDWDKYEPRLFGSSAVEDMSPHLPREELEAQMSIPLLSPKKSHPPNEVV